MWCRRRESNDTRLLILRNLLQTYERKNRTTRCMPTSYVQNHVQQFEGRVSIRPLNAGLRSSPSRIQDSIRELPDGNVSAGRRDAGGSRCTCYQDSKSHMSCGAQRFISHPPEEVRMRLRSRSPPP